ncbi:sulfatase [Flavobacterium album]|uniref:Sulfatase n=1 Tax=Flavobacterium album TaxID=2175091 RepID=A0A2S1QZ81_9FLAO|nr:LTA synthase family protein [Flavobacterium album]AWH85551.1 sulfatase [Flavobacterium album]
MNSTYRVGEYKALLYRLLLAYFFYFIVRLLFFAYNYKLLKVDSVGEYLRLYYHGIAFDTTAILYTNLLFILFSILPFTVNTRKGYQKFLMWLYFITNLISYATNFGDFIYYKYIYARTTVAVIDVIKNEDQGSMLLRFMVSYWHVFLLFFITAFLWVWLYKKVKVQPTPSPDSKLKYFAFSTVAFLFIGTMIVGGIRGDFKKSTRPINIIDANRHVTKPEHADIVLNTPFSIIRTFNVTSFKKVDFAVDEKVITEDFHPIKLYNNNPKTTPNIVLIITESMGREYWGCMNRSRNIPGFVSYTPFLDSLSQHSLIFDNSYANGSKSIHGMSSILAGIPSFKDAFTSSPYPKQKIESLVSTLKSMGYDTSFFHGAPNGSMGFLGFGNILGYDHYYGKTEYNNDADFDGSWGIWDEPFMQFMKNTLDQKKQPFFGTIFTVSSHEPYVVPEKYAGNFPKGTVPMHQAVGYTDYAFKKFFEAAKKSPWYKNTIFVITADHGNQIAYDEYRKVLNRSATPILIFRPDESLKGVDSQICQQIDIYPTILDLVGYDKPFMSWGRSLVGDKQVQPFAISYNGNLYMLQRGKYICTFDGKNVVGFYDINDKGLEHNLIDKKNKEMEETEIACKAFLQDYFERIIDKKLYYKK